MKSLLVIAAVLMTAASVYGIMHSRKTVKSVYEPVVSKETRVSESAKMVTEKPEPEKTSAEIVVPELKKKEHPSAKFEKPVKKEAPVNEEILIREIRAEEEALPAPKEEPLILEEPTTKKSKKLSVRKFSRGALDDEMIEKRAKKSKKEL